MALAAISLTPAIVRADGAPATHNELRSPALVSAGAALGTAGMAMVASGLYDVILAGASRNDCHLFPPCTPDDDRAKSIAAARGGVLVGVGAGAAALATLLVVLGVHRERVSGPKPRWRGFVMGVALSGAGGALLGGGAFALGLAESRALCGVSTPLGGGCDLMSSTDGWRILAGVLFGMGGALALAGVGASTFTSATKVAIGPGGISGTF